MKKMTMIIEMQINRFNYAFDPLHVYVNNYPCLCRTAAVWDYGCKDIQSEAQSELKLVQCVL